MKRTIINLVIGMVLVLSTNVSNATGGKARSIINRVKGYEYHYLIKPSTLKVEEVAEIQVQPFQTPDAPHPTFGERVPLEDLRVKVEVSQLGEDIKTGGVYKAHQLRVGIYAFHFTPESEGNYSVWFTGYDRTGSEVFTNRFKFTVGEWKLTPDMKIKDSLRSRGPIIGGATGKQTKAFHKLMNKIGNNFAKLKIKVSDAKKMPPKKKIEEILTILIDTAEKFKKTESSSFSRGDSQFKGFAGNLKDGFVELKDMKKPRKNVFVKELKRIETDICFKCHSKFRY